MGGNPRWRTTEGRKRGVTLGYDTGSDGFEGNEVGLQDEEVMERTENADKPAVVVSGHSTDTSSHCV